MSLKSKKKALTDKEDYFSDFHIRLDRVKPEALGEELASNPKVAIKENMCVKRIRETGSITSRNNK